MGGDTGREQDLVIISYFSAACILQNAFYLLLLAFIIEHDIREGLVDIIAGGVPDHHEGIAGENEDTTTKV